NGDAFVDLLDLAAATDRVPEQVGERPHLSILVPEEGLRTGLGTALLDGTLPIPAARIRHVACDAGLIPVVLDSQSVPLDLGRSVRTATVHLRRALVARDRGCCFPGCDRPPHLTQVHHLTEWEHMGETSLANTCLLCGFHHRLLHNSPWEVRMAADGRPEFLPPAVIDPERRPRRNPINTPAA
ncbi:MAG: DUF222 domain-containing protein, partial [Pseudonocardiaceae bacterium]|nr:DUF222 domain-containing protein [Pseudonocardiaceae bacterium]